jgi:hypothetical protein
MKEAKSKKTGLIQIWSDEEYEAIAEKGVINLRNFTITDLKVRSLIPTLKEPVKIIKEVKPTKRKNEG